MFFKLILAFVGVSVSAQAQLPAELLTVQKSFFELSYQSYVNDLQHKHPELLRQSPPPRGPQFSEKLSRLQWIESFSQHLIGGLGLNGHQADLLRKASEELFISFRNGGAYGRVPFLVEEKPSELSPESVEISGINLPRNYPANHTLDVQAYVAERFPAALQRFVQRQKVIAYLDNDNCEAAKAQHQQEGFSQSFRFMGKRESSESQFVFVYHPKKRQYRLAICDIRGEDDKTRMVKMIGPVFKNSALAYFVRHLDPAPLIGLNLEGQALQIDSRRDLVMIGFQNTLWWELKEKSSDWLRIPLNDRGADLAMFKNQKTQQQIISLANVYGDEILEALQLLYSKGARRFVYLGTAGALDERLNIGDLLVPSHFKASGVSWLGFENHLLLTGLNFEFEKQILWGARHGWVATLIEESRDFLMELQRRNVQALDVEALHLAKFLSEKNADVQASVLLVISDKPLGGGENYNNENATRSIPMESIKKALPAILETHLQNGEPI